MVTCLPGIASYRSATCNKLRGSIHGFTLPRNARFRIGYDSVLLSLLLFALLTVNVYVVHAATPTTYDAIHDPKCLED